MGPSYTSGTVVGPVAPQGDIVLPSSKSGSGKKVAIIVVIVLLVLVAVGVGIWFFVNRESGFGGTAEQRFNRFANYLLYEEDSDEWTHGEEEFSMDLADDFEDRFYTYSEEEWGNYMGKVKKLWESYTKVGNSDDEYMNGINLVIAEGLNGFIEVFGYVRDSDLFGSELYDAYSTDGRSVSTLINERYASIMTSELRLSREIGKNLDEHDLALLETYTLSSPTNVIDKDDGEVCYVFDGYDCLDWSQVEQLRSKYYGEMMTKDDERYEIVEDGVLNLVYSSWQTANLIKGEENV